MILKLLAILIYLLPFFCAAQKADFRLYTIADGLPQNATSSITQDKQGFIWVNVSGRLTRFDGTQFLHGTNVNHPIFRSNRLPLNSIYADGEFLHFCQNGQLVSINTATGEESLQSLAGYLPVGADTMSAICEALNDSEVAVVCKGREAMGEIFLLPLEKGKIGQTVRLAGVNLNILSHIICSDGTGNFFCLSQDFETVIQFDNTGKKLREIPVKISPGSLFLLLPGSNQSVLLVVGTTIWRLKQGATAFELHPFHNFRATSNELYFLDALETSDGNLWVSGNSRNLFFFDAKLGKVFNYQQELEHIIPNQVDLGGMFLDKSGNIWVASSSGLLEVAPKTVLFNTWFTDKSTACGGFCSFRGFAEDEIGNVYASFYSNIFQISLKGEAIALPLLPASHVPYDILFHNGYLFLNNGFVFDPQRRLLSNPFKSSMASTDVGVLAKDGKGKIWQTNGDAFYEFDGNLPSQRWTLLHSFQDQSFATDMAFDAYNQLVWYCNATSLRSYDPSKITFKDWGEAETGQLYKPKCLYPNGKGKLWIGTEQGLICFDYSAKTAKRFTQADGLPSDIVVGILPEGDSCLWLSTFNGLSRLSIDNGKFINFFKQDGLADNEFNRASFFKATDGRMFFGGTKGITSFYPKEVMRGYARQETREQLQLRSISMTKDGSDNITTQVFNGATDRLEIYHYNRNVSIGFGVFDENEGGQTLYIYMLEGQDKNWSVPSKNNSVTFYSLPSGNYVFRVRALNARGHWLSEEITLPLIVHPPWRATWWAYLLYALVLAAIAFSIFYFIKKRLELKTQLQFEQQEAERLKELDSFKSRVFTNLTHEFRTPLTVILGMADELAVGSWQSAVSGQEKQRMEKGLGQVSKNGQNLLRLINQLLDLSKLEDNSFKLKLQHTDIVPYLRYVTESFQSIANGRNLSLRFFTTLEKLEMDFDAEQVQQVISNLLSNALKFTPSGGEIKLRLTIDDLQLGAPLSKVGHRPSAIVIQVSDTGSGILEADLPHIFDRFYQIDGAVNQAGGGSGIGLAHARELVKLMGGEIRVDSEFGSGTTFTVVLPLTHLSSAPKAEPFPSKPTDLLTFELPSIVSPLGGKGLSLEGNPQILLIEDNSDVVAYLKTILQDRYDIEIAYNGRIGIEKALEQIPDLIISDVMMPERDGYQVLDALKNDERTSHIPILLLTAKADASSKIAGLRRGADSYMSKPFHKAELLATLEMMQVNKQRLATHFSKKYSLVPPLTMVINEGNPAIPPDKEAVIVEDAFLQKVRKIVDTSFSDAAFALPQLCEAVNMSRSQLFRKMKALTNVSPSDFIRNYRMAQAKLLLETTQLSVKEVAWEVGFKEVPHFSKSFQETYGMTPSMVRKGN
ncbi:MAG: helix-turn-helix domain-containing protein [Saprospiraceae bacterium]|nr:helix-turn-helix domain-containing protein [Saprospiraceae bacterium]MCF8443323.1 helix-turn-helix domain-containing protein [Saprospiraceae bacterium]